MIGYRLGNDFAVKLAETLKNMEVSQTNVGPAEALRAVNQLFGEPEEERRILYIISDFRSKDWNDPVDVKKMLQQWQTAQTEKIRLVSCIDQVRANLAIAALKPEKGSARQACRGLWTWRSLISAKRRPKTCRWLWAKTATCARRSSFRKFHRVKP